jgi:hypothetical protein
MPQAEPEPIWLAALNAARCRAFGNGGDRMVRWDFIAGRAVYTNESSETEMVQPLGVPVQGGASLAVYWIPGETGYSTETYHQNQQNCA